MIMDAHIHNFIELGSYDERLNKTLKKTTYNLYSVQLEEPESDKLLCHQILGKSMQAMSRRSKLEKLEEIGR